MNKLLFGKWLVHFLKEQLLNLLELLLELCTKITGPCPVTFYLLGHDNQDDLQLSQPTWGSFEMSKLVYLCNHLNKKYKTKKLNRKHISIGILWFLYIQVIQKLLLTKIQILN